MLPALVFCSLIIALYSSLGAASQLQVGDSDKQVVYSPAAIGDCQDRSRRGPCSNKWFTQSIDGTFRGSVKTTFGTQASLQLTFQGSSITVIGVRDKDGARALVSIDGAPATTAHFSANDGQRHVGETVFSSGDLNPNTPHTLVLWYDPQSAGVGHGNRTFVRVDAFLITFPDNLPGPFPASGSITPTASSNTAPPFTQPVTNPDPTDRTPESTASPPPPAVVGTRSSRSSAVPIVAGLVTGLGTLFVAGGILFWFFRRRRAVPVQSMTPVRTSMPAHAAAGAGAPPRGGLLARATYAFTRRGSSVASSSDPPVTQTAAPPPSVPRLTAFVNPYTYRHTYDYTRSADSTSLGPPVDERPPNVPQPPLASPISPARTSPPRRLQVFNPDANTVVSSESSGSGTGRR